MAQVVNVNFKLDYDTKSQMERVCEALGLSLSAAFTIFAKKMIFFQKTLKSDL